MNKSFEYLLNNASHYNHSLESIRGEMVDVVTIYYKPLLKRKKVFEYTRTRSLIDKDVDKQTFEYSYKMQPYCQNLLSAIEEHFSLADSST